jgi:transposase
VNEVLASLSAEFAQAYSHTGRPSIPPERLVRALLLQAFYSIRSECQLMEQLDFNLLFRWFVGLGIDDAVWDASTFCKNRDRFLEADVSARFLQGIITHKKVRRLLSRDHFSVDGTLIEAWVSIWASMKSFRRKDGNDGNGWESRLCYIGHALMENRNGLVVDGGVTRASGTAEREAALEMVDRRRPVDGKGGKRRITLGGDKGFDVAEHVAKLRQRKVTPHVAVQDHLSKTGKRRKTLIDGRTTRHPGYAVSQRIRKRIEEIFGWVKVQGGQNKTRFRGRRRVEASFTLALAAATSSDCPGCWERARDRGQKPPEATAHHRKQDQSRAKYRDQKDAKLIPTSKRPENLGSRQSFSSLLDKMARHSDVLLCLSISPCGNF